MLSVSGPIRKRGGGGGAVGFWPDTKREGQARIRNVLEGC